MKRVLLLGLLVFQSAAAQPALTLSKGDHIAIVGSGLADRQQHHGWLEALIHRAHPDLDLTIRNLGFAADEINVRPRSDEAPTTEYFLSMRKGDTVQKRGNTEVIYKAGSDFGADVILAYWGFNESFRGPDHLSSFKSDLEKYLTAQHEAKYNGESAPRIVLISPLAHQNLNHPNFSDGSENNRNLALYTAAMKEVAAAKNIPFIDLFSASQELFSTHDQPLTLNGIHLTEEGDKLLAPIQFNALFGKDPAPLEDPALEKIRTAVLDKNTEWHHRYRTVDQYNIYGGRSRIEYEGVTNAEILGEEMAQRDVKAANRDRRVWALAKGNDLQVKDDNLPPVRPTPTNRPQEKPYLSGEEAIKHLTLAEGFKVELVASEETFPELVNPVQMAFDTRGRLWVAAWPAYPGTTPNEKVFDKLLVINLDPETGKAAKITTFMDGLNCPTGFQFYKDGVLVMQSPDLLWARDTTGDGKADTVERMLHGLDAADSHHETNSMCLEPGGAVYLSDGVFHRTSVETPDGPVRNRDGAIYRYEPNTSKFTRHIPYGFANPHGRVFDRWGNDLVTDATGNANYFGPAFSGHLDSGSHPPMKQFWDRPSRPCAGTAILSSRHFPEEMQGQFLNANVISIQGILRAKLTDEGSGIKGETLEHLITTDIAAHPNFRPSGITVAPDGSLYLMDWSQMLIGHLQHHLRDPNRDHQHGRLYRITCEGRPLLDPKPIHGQPVAALLELLKEPENDVRMRAKIELGNHDPKEVAAAAKAWIGTLDPQSPDHEHHVLEALWVHQWHNVADLELLARVLKSPEPRARAQAVRVACYWRDRVPNLLEIIRAAAGDEAPRVRLEAVRTASFLQDWQAADAALEALKRPTDDYIDYCLTQTMKQLEPWWKPSIRDGKPLAANNPAGIDFLLASVSTGDLGKLPPSPQIHRTLLTRDDATADQRIAALAALAKAEGKTPAGLLLSALQPIATDSGKPVEALGRLLVAQPADALAKHRAEILSLTRPAVAPSLRVHAWTALMQADGSLDPSFADAGKSPEQLPEWLHAAAALNDPALRASVFEKARATLDTRPAADARGGVSGRFVRITLPRRGTLTLAEVEIISGGKNIARGGKATQSSVSNDGVASRAIDGRTDGSYGSGTQTHTNEGENNPWWEVDLGKDRLVEAVTLWNRSEQGGQFASRLEGFDLIVLDSNRQETFKKSGNPAPETSDTLKLDGDPTAPLRTAAIRALIASGREPAQVFETLTGLIQRRELVETAARAALQLPRESWSTAEAAPTLGALTAWTGGIPASARTRPDFIETLRFADELAALLPAAEATAARRTLRDLGVRSFVVKAVPEKISFDVTRLVVEAGKPFELIFENPDAIPHNLLIVTPGSRQAVSEAVLAQPPTKLDSQGRAYVPDGDPRVIAATKLLEAGQKEILEITAPTEEGTYEYVCTFPGHWTIMWGELIVTQPE